MCFKIDLYIYIYIYICNIETLLLPISIPARDMRTYSATLNTEGEHFV